MSRSIVIKNLNRLDNLLSGKAETSDELVGGAKSVGAKLTMAMVRKYLLAHGGLIESAPTKFGYGKKKAAPKRKRAAKKGGATVPLYGGMQGSGVSAFGGVEYKKQLLAVARAKVRDSAHPFPSFPRWKSDKYGGDPITKALGAEYRKARMAHLALLKDQGIISAAELSVLKAASKAARVAAPKKKKAVKKARKPAVPIRRGGRIYGYEVKK